MNIILDREALVSFLEAKNIHGCMDLIRAAESEQVNEGHHGHVFVNGIVSHRTKLPMVQLDLDGRLVILDVAQARQVASDIYLLASRAEADALIIKFVSTGDAADDDKAAAAMMMFRDFRAELDAAADKDRI